MPSAVAARKTKEFRCSPKEQVKIDFNIFFLIRFVYVVCFERNHKRLRFVQLKNALHVLLSHGIISGFFFSDESNFMF